MCRRCRRCRRWKRRRRRRRRRNPFANHEINIYFHDLYPLPSPPLPPSHIFYARLIIFHFKIPLNIDKWYRWSIPCHINVVVVGMVMVGGGGDGGGSGGWSVQGVKYFHRLISMFSFFFFFLSMHVLNNNKKKKGGKKKKRKHLINNVSRTSEGFVWLFFFFTFCRWFSFLYFFYTLV